MASRNPTRLQSVTGHPARLLVALILLTVIAICSAAETRRSDPDNLVSYVLPDGWDDQRTGNGRHFTRAGLPDDPNFLGVLPRARDDYSSLENIRRDRSAVHAAQDHRQRSSQVRRVNGFEVWESIYDAQIRGQAVVFHDAMMFSDDLVIEVHLNASKRDYADFAPDLQLVVESMQETRRQGGR